MSTIRGRDHASCLRESIRREAAKRAPKQVWSSESQARLVSRSRQPSSAAKDYLKSRMVRPKTPSPSLTVLSARTRALALATAAVHSPPPPTAAKLPLLRRGGPRRR